MIHQASAIDTEFRVLLRIAASTAVICEEHGFGCFIGTFAIYQTGISRIAN
jgi:hypothetical protein